MNTNFDIAIIGAGPGGLASGLYTSRARIKTVCFEKGIPGGQMNNTDIIENYPGFLEIKGYELSEKMAEQAKHFGLEIKTEEVQVIAKKDKLVSIKTNKDEYQVKACVIATGGSPKQLGAKGEKEFYGKGVSYCAICDGAFFKDVPIAVIGGGDSAAEEALFLTKFGSKVYVVHRREEFRASHFFQEQISKNKKIEPVLGYVLEDIYGDKVVKGIKVKNVKNGEIRDINVNACFIYVGFIPNTTLVKDKIEKDKLGFYKVDENLMTSIPGIFAIGDNRSDTNRQIAIATGDGAMAAIEAEKYINEHFKG